LALMSLLRQNWNGNKKGAIGNYPARPNQIWRELDKDIFLYRPRPAGELDVGEPRKVDYLGHNIACLAVDGDGDIIDFDFNHNEVFSSSVEHAESRLIRRLLVHVITIILKLVRPGGVRAVVAESVLAKHQLLILNRSRQRAPNLRALDRLIAGICSLWIKPNRLRRVAIAFKPSTLLDFHRALVKRKYRLLFSPKQRPK